MGRAYEDLIVSRGDDLGGLICLSSEAFPICLWLEPAGCSHVPSVVSLVVLKDGGNLFQDVCSSEMHITDYVLLPNTVSVAVVVFIVCLIGNK